MLQQLLETYDLLASQVKTILPSVATGFLVVKILAGLIIFALIAFLTLIIIKFLKLRKKIKEAAQSKFKEAASGAQQVKESFPRKKVSREWQAVLDKLDGSDESGYKLAVIEADKILDDILKKAGFAGESMGDRLKNMTKSDMANLDDAWKVHSIRNKLVHETDFRLTQEQAKAIVKIYERALREMGAM